MSKDKKIEPCEDMARIARKYLSLDRWKFKESVRLREIKFPKIIYDSEWCRVNFSWGGMEMFSGYTINIFYGRLHAPSDDKYMIWNGEKCYCWHDISTALNFLDGRSPKDIAGRNYGRPRVMEQFVQSEVGQSLKDRRFQPEWLARMHAAIWDDYGNRLFELFDLRQPELWEKYRNFVKSLYDLEGRSPNIKPPLDSIC